MILYKCENCGLIMSMDVITCPECGDEELKSTVTLQEIVIKDRADNGIDIEDEENVRIPYDRELIDWD